MHSLGLLLDTARDRYDMIFLVLLFACSLVIGDAVQMDTFDSEYSKRICDCRRYPEPKGTDDPVTVNPEHPKRTDERALRGLQTAYGLKYRNDFYYPFSE